MSITQYYGTGRRKTSVARVYLRPGHGKIVVNKTPIENYFDRDSVKAVLKQPLGHSGAVHQRCCEQQRSGAHPVEGAGAIGGAHKDPPAADAFRCHRQG